MLFFMSTRENNRAPYNICVATFYLPLARRAGDYKTHSVRESVCHIFKKGCTLVVSPWPFQCFMTLLLMSFHLMLFFQT